MALPGLLVDWNAAVPTGGQVFLRYNVYRRVFGEPTTTWIVVFQTTDSGVTSYTDYAISSGVSYEYAVTWVANVAGVEFESAFQDPEPTAVHAFEHVFIHNFNTPANFVEIDTSEQIRVARQDRVEMVKPWGRSSPTAHVGEADFRHVDVTAWESWAERGALWGNLEQVIEDQREEGAVLVLRLGYAQEKYFCALRTLRRADQDTSGRPTLSLVETHYEEGIQT